jgi:transcriptional regulator with XRE-family HTH domain
MSNSLNYVPFRAIVGKIIAGYRSRLGLHQIALAGNLGMTQANFSRLETGEAIINVEQLAAIAQALGTTSAAILTEAEQVAASIEAEGYKVVRVRSEAKDNWHPLATAVLAGLILTALINSKK